MNKNWMFTLVSTVTLILLATGCETMGKKGEDDKDEKEQAVTMDQLPAAVKTTLMKEAGSGKVEEIEKMMKSGKTVYEADVMADGKKWEIVVREDGQLLRKELDEEDDKEDEKDDDDKK